MFTLALAPQTPSSASIVATVWDMVVKGGWTMIPLAGVSLVALAIAVERFILTRKSRVAPPALAGAIATLKPGPADLLARWQHDTSPLAGVLTAAARCAAAPLQEQERRIAEAGEREVRKLRQRFRLMSVLPQTATMLGLLGTVFGMIRTFTVVAASAESLGKTERLAQGIYEAWTATAAGLVIAIPTLVAYQMLMARVDSAASLLDRCAQDWLDASPTPARVVRDVPTPPAPTRDVDRVDLVPAAG